MSYLSRDASPFSDEFWKLIDSAVVDSASSLLAGRRFLHVFGPLGIGVSNISVDDSDAVEEVETDGLIITKGRRYIEIPTIYDDFTLSAKDLESTKKTGFPADLSKVMASAEACALKEDKLIFFGNSKLGYEGLLTASGVNKLKKKDWSTGENAFADVAAAIGILTEQSIYGTYSLVLSPDLYMHMQRLQPATGLLEIDRVGKLLNGHIYKSPVLGKEKAALVCSDERNMDLVVGQDMAAAYLEQKDLNHILRVLETVMLRIKRRKAIVVFE